MKNQIIVIFLMLVLSIPMISLIDNQTIVKADSPAPELDYDYILEVTTNLSDCVYKYPDHDLDKGRMFASYGERKATEYLAEEMENIGLYDPTGYSEYPYREPITNVTTNWGPVMNKLFADDPLTTKLEVLDRNLTIRNMSDPGNDFYVEECYISPRWNLTRIFKSLDKDKLTHCYTETDVHIEHPPGSGQYFGLGNLTWFNDFITDVDIETKILTNLSTNASLITSYGIKAFLLQRFQDYYDFELANININVDSTWPDTFTQFLKGYNYVTIREDTRFNPYKDKYPEEWATVYTDYADSGLKDLFYDFMYEISIALWHILNPEYKGLLEYDFNDKTYDMNLIDKTAKPVISINGTLGKEINASVSNFRLNYTLDQRWNKSVESYNVIGQINGTNDDKYIVISCLLDSLWCSGTADSAIGMGIVMALAKYMQDLKDSYGVTPRYDIRFIGFSGEEYGLVGAKHYNFANLEDNITVMIDLNQLGFNLSKLGLNIEDKFRLELWTNRFPLTYYLDHIGDRSQYEERIDDYTTFEIKCGDTQPIINRFDGGRPGNQNVFAFSRPLRCTTLYLLKMGPWKYHHRDGQDHTEGDAIKYYDGDDVNISGELAFNLSKFFCYQNLTWFDGDPQFTIGDSADPNNDNDWLNVTFTIDTNMPCEPATVHLLLHPKFTLLHPLWPLSKRHRETAQYLVTPTGKSGFINISLPNDFPKYQYIAKLYLCSSIGDDWLGGLEKINYSTCGTEYIESVTKIGDIDLFSILSNNASEIADLTGLPIINYLKNIEDIRPFRPLLMDFCGYYAFSDDHAKQTGLYLAPPRNPPNKPEVTDGPNQVFRGRSYEFKANATDPEEDPMHFKWYWGGLSYSSWSLDTYEDNEKHTMEHMWKLLTNPDNIEVRVKACDTILNPNYHSAWSDPWAMTVDEGCNYVALAENGFQPNSLPNQNIVLVNQNMTFSGMSYGFTGRLEFSYDFDDSTNSSLQNPVHSFNSTGCYNVTLTVENGTSSATYSAWIHVVNTSAGFNVSTFGAQPNQTIIFTDAAQSIRNITDYLWDFDDGNTSTTQSTSHAFPEVGVYNVTLNVTDNASELSGCYLRIYVEDTSPTLVDVHHEPSIVCLESNVTIYADVFDNQSEVDTVTVNITQPDGTHGNYTMIVSLNSTYDYEYLFENTSLAGWHHFTIWAKDHANNVKQSEGLGFPVTHAFGSTIPGNQTQDVHNRISGTNYTGQTNGRADSITAYLNTSNTTSNITCMIYQGTDLIGITEEKTVTTTEAQWITFNITGTKPNLTADTSYILCGWSNDTCLLYYNTVDQSNGKYDSETYTSTPPDPASWTSENRNYSIYCSYTTFPVISNVTATPDPVGFGHKVSITAKVNDTVPIDYVYVNITKPDSNSSNFTMWSLGNNVYEYNFTDTWITGQYNYTIWATNELATINSSTGHSFNLSVNATIHVCTIKDNYTSGEWINLTDPPIDPPYLPIGYELLDNDSVLHLWNNHDSYYFNISSGIQLTNHKDEYWTKNVLMLGYYNNDQWNLIYRTDELTNFTKQIETDNQTYVNATLWKDLSFQGYDFRLAIRYHLGVDDINLTIIPYIKNIDDEGIPYTLGFGWELKDIQIAMTKENDWIDINRTSYLLNSSINQTYTSMDQPSIYIREYMTNNTIEELYLKWNKSLTYKVQVKSRDGQYNSPVTLFIRIGTLDSGQEKHTKMQWHDGKKPGSPVTYYFNAYNLFGEKWTTTPDYMVDGDTDTSAVTSTDSDIQDCTGNTCPGSDWGIIDKVELRVLGKHSGVVTNIILTPEFGGTSDGDDHYFSTSTSKEWSSYFDITDDTNAPGTWDWDDVDDLDCDVKAVPGAEGSFTAYCYKVDIRVTFSDYVAPTVTNPNPEDGQPSVSPTPTLNVTVDDENDDLLTAYWYSNSSGSWALFATNDSINTATGAKSITQTNTNFSSLATTYYWSVNVTDDRDWTNKTYHFTTETITTSVNTISPYLQISSPVNITANGSSSLDNVTLWYRYSLDNSTWTSSWWNTSWQSRKMLTISNNIQGYQTKINVTKTTGGDINCSGMCQNDFGELRFVDQTHTNLLPFWIEHYVNGSYAWIWVRNEYNDTTIYLYYNTSSTMETTSNGTTTFPMYFDDWKNDNTGDFTQVVSGDSKYTYYYQYLPNNLTNWSNVRLRCKFNTSYWDTGNYGGYVRYALRNHSNGYYFMPLIAPDTDYSYCSGDTDFGFRLYNRNGTTTTTDTGTLTGFLDNWYTIDIRLIGETYVNASVFDYDSEQLKIWANSSTNVPSAADMDMLRYLIWHGNEGGSTHAFSHSGDDYLYLWCKRGNTLAEQKHYIDFMYIAKYYNPEPIINLGDENDGGWQIWDNISNPDTSSPWQWNFNCPDGRGYYEFYSIGKASGADDESPPTTADARCHYGNQSKIKNTGTTSFKGYLLIQVQYYNSSTGNWTVADDTVNESTLRNIGVDFQLALDTIFNGLVNTNGLSSFGSGTYRIYTAFRDPDGNVLECDEGTKLEATTEFTITFS